KWLTSDAFNSGAVRLSLRLLHWNGSAWTTVGHTGESQVFATKTTASTFPDKVIHWTVSEPHNHRFRVEAFIRWVTPDATTIGSVLVLIDHYRVGYNGSVQSSCVAHHSLI